jgi:FimV-like protein
MQWYLALAYLADGQAEKGLELLRQIASNSGDESVKNDARQLLKKIE